MIQWAEVAARVHVELVEQLMSRDGLLAQLYATTRLLQRVDQGDYPGMAVPLLWAIMKFPRLEGFAIT